MTYYAICIPLELLALNDLLRIPLEVLTLDYLLRILLELLGLDDLLCILLELLALNDLLHIGTIIITRLKREIKIRKLFKYLIVL